MPRILNRDIADGTLPLHQHVTYKLARLNAKMTAQATRILKETADLSLSQWRILSFLEQRQHATMAEFVRFSGFDKGQMSRSVKELVRAGLVTGEIGEVDQRTQELRLTSLGRETFERARPSMRGRQASLLNCLSEAERQSFYSVLDKLERTVDHLEEEV
ncbi:MAG: MarR family transcriptional regulator [Rhizobiaceae bacterium]|nr:MarR family transcriptional regulator [Rhizobiaceae bacterium]